MAEKKNLTNLEQLKLLAQKTKEELTALDTKITTNAGKVPTKVSELQNDSKFQTQEEVSTAISTAIAGADHLQRKIVTSTEDINPEEEGSDKYIYMVPRTGEENENKYDEYMVIDQKIEKVGDWGVDLGDYAKTSDLQNYVQKEEGKSLIETEKITKLDNIKEGANKVEAADDLTSGKLKIDGVETEVYQLPETVLTDTDLCDDTDVQAMLTEVFSPAE